MKRIALVAVLVLAMFNLVFAAEPGVSLTVYNQDFALVKDLRKFSLEKGLNQIEVADIADKIVPASVHFKSLTEPGSCVIEEQNYEYDLLGSIKLLSKYIGKSIRIVTKDNSVYEGELLSYSQPSFNPYGYSQSENALIISDSKDKTLHMINVKDNIKSVDLLTLPEGLKIKPTLVWKIKNNKLGDHLVELSYITKGIKWNCDYVAVVDSDDKNIDLSSWVTIDNKSGIAYENANLKLMAADINLTLDEMFQLRAGVLKSSHGSTTQDEDTGFTQGSFFEYHLYSLKQKTTVKDNQTKQISLFNASNIQIKKVYVFEPKSLLPDIYRHNQQQNNTQDKVRVKMEFTNNNKNNLGIPLPKGKVRVYKKDADGGLEFIGEDSIDHTAVDENLKLYLGNAFDVVAERKNLGNKAMGNTSDETYEITFRNHKNEDIEMIVIEKLSTHPNWEISSKSHDFKKTDSKTIEFRINVPRNGEAKVIYTVHYWR